MLPCECNASSESSDSFDSTLGPIVQCHHTRMVLSYPFGNACDIVLTSCYAMQTNWNLTVLHRDLCPVTRGDRHGCAVAFVSKAATRFSCNGTFTPIVQEHGSEIDFLNMNIFGKSDIFFSIFCTQKHGKKHPTDTWYIMIYQMLHGLGGKTFFPHQFCDHIEAMICHCSWGGTQFSIPALHGGPWGKLLGRTSVKYDIQQLWNQSFSAWTDGV